MNDNEDWIKFEQLDKDYVLSGIPAYKDYNVKTTIRIFANDGYSPIIS